MRKSIFIFAIVLIAFASCNSTDNYIIPVNYEKYYEGVTSLTEKEDHELSFRVYMAWYNNTVGKEIPNIKVKNLDGKTMKLKKLLKKETILIFSDPYCGWGGEEIEKEFPATIQIMKDKLEGIDILCLIENSEEYNQQKVDEFARNLQIIYGKVYLIDTKDALRANLTGSPTKFFIDKEQIVRHIQMGFDLDQGRHEDALHLGLELMRKEKQQ